MSSLILRDQYGIHPDEARFVESKVKEILKQYEELNLLSMKALERVWAIGQLLIELKGKVFDGQWMNFCKDNFKGVSHSTITNYMRMAAYKPKLLEHTPLATVANGDDFPGVRVALNLIKSWTKRKSRSERNVTPREYCPTCGQPLSKRVKIWMSRHPAKV